MYSMSTKKNMAGAAQMIMLGALSCKTLAESKGIFSAPKSAVRSIMLYKMKGMFKK
jgi:hypothetical protein